MALEPKDLEKVKQAAMEFLAQQQATLRLPQAHGVQINIYSGSIDMPSPGCPDPHPVPKFIEEEIKVLAEIQQKHQLKTWAELMAYWGELRPKVLQAWLDGKLDKLLS